MSETIWRLGYGSRISQLLASCLRTLGLRTDGGFDEHDIDWDDYRADHKNQLWQQLEISGSSVAMIVSILVVYTARSINSTNL